MRVSYFVLCFLCLTAISCEKDYDPLTITINPGDTVSLALHQSASLQTAFFKITLQEIIEDSRCPSNGACIWRGRAVASFVVQSIDGKQTIELAEYDNPNIEPKTSIQVFGHTITMLEVTPWPESSNSIKDEDYRVVIQVQ